MAKLTLTDIAAGYALIATYNANNALIEAALENTVSRDGTTPNTMSADLDMNSQQITNLPTPIETSHATSKAYVDGLISAVQSAGDFSEALVYDFSNTITFSGGNIIRFRDGSSVRILGPADTGQVSNTHDDTDFITSFTATTDWDITTLTGNMWLRDGAGFKLSNATDDKIMTIVHNDTDVTVTADGGTPNFHLVDAWLALKVDGTLKLQEKAAAVADDAAYGQIWVKNNAPNELWFTDDTGVDHEVAGVKGSFTGTLTGYASGPTGTVAYTIQNGICTMYISSAITGTSDAATMTMTGLPAAVQSTNVGSVPCIINDNTALKFGAVAQLAAGTLTFYCPDASGILTSGGFTASGTKGLGTGWTITFPIV